MRNRWASVSSLMLLIFGLGIAPAFPGDSLYGTVRDVKSADLVTLDYGKGSYPVRLIGIEVPREGPIAQQARDLVAKLVLGKNARIRIEGRNEKGELVSRLFTDDPVLGIKEVNLELVRAGLARRRKDYDYMYGELSKAEGEARKQRRGLWATEQPQ
jgi:endonuclease YncB( thermonuclease family)